MEMFPLVGRSQLQQMVSVMTVESAIDILLSRKKPSTKRLDSLLKEHASRTILDETTHIEVARACIANRAKEFYKSCLHRPSRLKRGLCIKLSGESGLDAGAIKNDFFLGYFRRVEEELFEGNATRLVPRNYWGIESEMEMAGAAVAHSLLLGGPGFPVLHPAVYAHLSIRSVDPEDVLDYPCADDIPLNAATVDTKDLIDKVHMNIP